MRLTDFLAQGRLEVVILHNLKHKAQHIQHFFGKLFLAWLAVFLQLGWAAFKVAYFLRQLATFLEQAGDDLERLTSVKAFGQGLGRAGSCSSSWGFIAFNLILCGVKVITLNVNGIRSSAQKGLIPWLKTQDADFVLLQEVRALEHQLPDLSELGLHTHWFAAEKAGYSGVGILSKQAPQTAQRGFGHAEFDAEGRTITLGFEGLSVVSAYFPSGSSSEERQAAKYRFLEAINPYLLELQTRGEVLLGGDLNIAHHEIDIKNWRSNIGAPGFQPEERAWLTRLLESGYSDVFRNHVGQTEHYSWWSSRGRARENNVGWRIDYQLCSAGLAARVEHASIYRERFFSDHAPVILEFKDSV
jgi:exodeoxyribonuclease III